VSPFGKVGYSQSCNVSLHFCSNLSAISAIMLVLLLCCRRIRLLFCRRRQGTSSSCTSSSRSYFQ
jgi:hypothetical protein